jgi:hypothetical protein
VYVFCQLQHSLSVHEHIKPRTERTIPSIHTKSQNFLCFKNKDKCSDGEVRVSKNSRHQARDCVLVRSSQNHRFRQAWSCWSCSKLNPQNLSFVQIKKTQDRWRGAHVEKSAKTSPYVCSLMRSSQNHYLSSSDMELSGLAKKLEPLNRCEWHLLPII